MYIVIGGSTGGRERSLEQLTQVGRTGRVRGGERPQDLAA
jgi:hypothetical protein